MHWHGGRLSDADGSCMHAGPDDHAKRAGSTRTAQRRGSGAEQGCHGWSRIAPVVPPEIRLGSCRHEGSTQISATKSRHQTEPVGGELLLKAFVRHHDRPHRDVPREAACRRPASKGAGRAQQAPRSQPAPTLKYSGISGSTAWVGVAGKSWIQAGASGRRCATVAMSWRCSKAPAGWRYTLRPTPTWGRGGGALQSCGQARIAGRAGSRAGGQAGRRAAPFQARLERVTHPAAWRRAACCQRQALGWARAGGLEAHARPPHTPTHPPPTAHPPPTHRPALTADRMLMRSPLGMGCGCAVVRSPEMPSW